MPTLNDLAFLSGDELYRRMDQMIRQEQPIGLLLKPDAFDWRTVANGDILETWFEEYLVSLELLTCSFWGIRKWFEGDPQTAFTGINTIAVNAILSSLILIRSEFPVDSFASLRLAHERTLSLLYVFQKPKEIRQRAHSWVKDAAFLKPGKLRQELLLTSEEYADYCEVVHMSGVHFDRKYKGAVRPSPAKAIDPRLLPSGVSSLGSDISTPSLSLETIWPDYHSWEPLPGNAESGDRKSIQHMKALYAATAHAVKEFSMLARANMRAACKIQSSSSRDIHLWRALLLNIEMLSPRPIGQHFEIASLNDLETRNLDDESA